MSQIAYTLIDSISESLYSALHRDLPSVERDGTYVRPTKYNITQVISFNQTFGHGSGLFGSISTASISHHQMVIICTSSHMALYQSGNFVFCVKTSEILLAEAKQFHIQSGDKRLY